MFATAVTLKQLRALLAVAQHRSLTAAAEALHQTTPSIHSQIRKLEDQAGRALLRRDADGSGFVLTPSGEAVARAARRINANLSQADADLRALSQGFRGHVRLSVVSSAQYFAPKLVRMLRDSLPDIEVSLHVGNREQVIAALDHGAADLIMMGRPPQDIPVVFQPLGAHPHGIIVPPAHPLALRDGFDPTHLLGEVLLTREEGSGTRALMMRYLERLSEATSPRLIEFTSNETIKQAVLAGLGIAFLSLHTVCEELRTGRLVALRGPSLPIMRQWYLVRPGDVAPNAATERVSDRIIALSGAYFPKLEA